jgi:hypothetical protein
MLAEIPQQFLNELSLGHSQSDTDSIRDSLHFWIDPRIQSNSVLDCPLRAAAVNHAETVSLSLAR